MLKSDQEELGKFARKAFEAEAEGHHHTKNAYWRLYDFYKNVFLPKSILYKIFKKEFKMNGSKTGDGQLGSVDEKHIRDHLTTEGKKGPGVKEIFQRSADLRERAKLVRDLADELRGRITGYPAEIPKDTAEAVDPPGILSRIYLELAKLAGVIEDTQTHLLVIKEDITE